VQSSRHAAVWAHRRSITPPPTHEVPPRCKRCGKAAPGRVETLTSWKAYDRAKERLAILEVLLAAVERRHDVVEAVWNSANDDEASARLRNVVDIPDGPSAQLILDHQIRLLTKEKRDALTAEISHLRQLAQGPSE
jgi:DNA gyrase/topoisomerase IV subunit A